MLLFLFPLASAFLFLPFRAVPCVFLLLVRLSSPGMETTGALGRPVLWHLSLGVAGAAAAGVRNAGDDAMAEFPDGGTDRNLVGILVMVVPGAAGLAVEGLASTGSRFFAGVQSHWNGGVS